MDYNSKGWQTFRRRVPYKIRLAIAWPAWALVLVGFVIVGAFVGAYYEAKEGYNAAQKYWPRGNK